MDRGDGSQQEEAERRAKAGEHVPPTFWGKFFHCIYCGVLTTQTWKQLKRDHLYEPIYRCQCRNCGGVSYWVSPDNEHGVMILPWGGRQGPMPHPDMPEDVLADYDEAREIVGKSPRGAGALARLAVQKLVNDLEPNVDGERNDLNAEIGRLVKNGLPPMIQEALDSLRVIGNNAVHPLELDLRDDAPTVVAMFDCMNAIVENQVAQPGRIRQLYEKLPEGARAAIDRRDKVEDENGA